MHIRQLRGWLVRLFGIFRRKQREREFAEELESHLALHIEDTVKTYLSMRALKKPARHSQRSFPLQSGTVIQADGYGLAHEFSLG